VSGVVVVGVGENLDAPLVNLAHDFDPLGELVGAIHDDLVPSLRPFLDSFAISEPADVGEVGGDGVELLEQLSRARHPGVVLEDQGDVVVAERAGEAGVEPALVANLDGELVAGWKFLHERGEQFQEFAGALEFGAVEIRKLQDHRPELGAEELHCFDELLEFGFGANQHFFVGDDLWNLHGKDEVVGSLARPAVDGGGGGSAVEGRVHFDGVKFCGVVGEVVGGLHSLGIERAFPSRGCEGGGAEVDAGRVVGGRHVVEASARVKERQAGATGPSASVRFLLVVGERG
jgi:hypothetical protein